MDEKLVRGDTEHAHEEKLDNFTDEDLFQMVKDSLEELGIAYEEKPGGFGEGPFLNPSIFDDGGFQIKPFVP